MTLRSRASILEAEQNSFLNKCFHMVSPVWRIRAICIIFMNTLSAWTSILFNLGVPRLKELLCEKKNFTAGEEEHMQRGDAPGQTMMQNNLKEQKGIEQD